jgi:protein-L-isoaspartate(D-aspartate) O-methyltransferase
MANSNLRKARRSYAEELRVAAPVQRNPEMILDAFASVPRERFLGPGPWLIGGNIKSYRTPDKNPRWLYHNVLISLDARKGINNGSPALWTYLFDQLDLKPGERVLQVGAGTGYYSAIIAALVGRRGRVYAVEFEKHLAARARANLRPWPQAEVVCGDASTFDAGEVDVVVAFAGGTHPATLWLERLAPRGRLLMSLVMDDRGGFMLKSRSPSWRIQGQGRQSLLVRVSQRIQNQERGQRSQESAYAAQGKASSVARFACWPNIALRKAAGILRRPGLLVIAALGAAGTSAHS